MLPLLKMKREEVFEPRIVKKCLKVFIIGGGKVSKAILETIGQDSSIEVVGLAEADPKAIALPLARSLGIPIFSNYRVVFEFLNVNLILNLTGDENLEEELYKRKSPQTEVIGTWGSKLIWNIIDLKERSANLDPLTGLYNVRFFYKALEAEIERGIRYNSNFSIIFMDIDHLKQINDTLGHLKGDEVIKKVAHTIISSLRSVDVAARYGGDEFAILLPETGVEEAAKIAKRIRSRITDLPLRGKLPSFTISIGISTFPKDGKTAKTLMSKADYCMYQVKKLGGDSIYF